MTLCYLLPRPEWSPWVHPLKLFSQQSEKRGLESCPYSHFFSSRKHTTWKDTMIHSHPVAEVLMESTHCNIHKSTSYVGRTCSGTVDESVHQVSLFMQVVALQGVKRRMKPPTIVVSYNFLLTTLPKNHCSPPRHMSQNEKSAKKKWRRNAKVHTIIASRTPAARNICWSWSSWCHCFQWRLLDEAPIGAPENSVVLGI